MNEDEILNAMERFGGSFVKQLAVLYRLADVDNRIILANSFTHYFAQYEKLAAELKGRVR